MSKSVKKLILLHITVAAVILIYYIQPFGCPILYFSGIECPTCGTTRALFAILKGDFASSFKLNPMALPAVFLVLFGFYGRLFVKNKRIYNTVLIIGSALIFISYVIRLFFC